MLTREQLKDAIDYNAKGAGKKYKLGVLPWQWQGVGPSEFAWVTALFQRSQGLGYDGKLGPNTFSRIKEWKKGLDDTSVEVPTKPPEIPGEVDDDKPVFESDGDYSNAIVVGGTRLVLPDEFIELGLTASNYMDDGEPQFKRKQRVKRLQHFVLHETCGNTATGCKNSLLRKGYGVQLILDAKGHLSCHGDLLSEQMVHGNQLNSTSIGMEVVNPYSPLYARAPFTKAIPREWWTWVPSKKMKGVPELLAKKGWSAVPKQYVLPTPEQMVAARMLVHWICEQCGIPYRFPTRGLDAKKPRIKGWNVKPRAVTGPGVVAHRDFASHADGRYMLNDLIERAS